MWNVVFSMLWYVGYAGVSNVTNNSVTSNNKGLFLIYVSYPPLVSFRLVPCPLHLGSRWMKQPHLEQQQRGMCLIRSYTWHFHSHFIGRSKLHGYT